MTLGTLFTPTCLNTESPHYYMESLNWLPLPMFVCGRQDCQVFIWSVDISSSSQNWTPKLLHKFNDVVWHLSWSITGNILAVSGGDNKVPFAHFWSLSLQMSLSAPR